ncbi:probable WRKY transcription factor 33 [Papaver somniferum]|nr:probable WRKY transcription factor 33 [Papaver somniferum]
MTSSGGGGSSGLDTTSTIEYPNFSFSTSNSNSTNHQFMNSSSFSDLLATNNYTTDSTFSNRGSGGYADRIGSGGGAIPKFKSTPPPSLPISPPSLAVSPSSYFSIPPGLSPAELLDSPGLLSSSNILPSPTTGSFPAHNPSFNWRSNSQQSNNNNTIKQETERRNTNNYSIVTSSSFSLPSSNDFSFQTQSWNSNSISSDNHNQRNIVKSEFPPPLLQGFSSLPPDHQFSSSSSTTTQQIQPPIHHQTLREKRRSEDGYNWRKYGQKQVKGSENPRSYYKCTFPNCPTKKKVERSLEGQITEIVYKGSHNHPKPTSTRRSSSSSLQSSTSLPSSHQQQPPLSSSSSIVVSALPISSDNHHGGNSSSQMELVTTPENSSNISIGEEVDFDHSSDHKSKSNGDEFDDHHDQEPEAKRWKRENEYEGEGISAPPAGSRTVREPRVVVQTTSDIDILDDGYRWRKYGQKVVKGNPNPRSYYKCTSNGCPVRKHVERASHDLRAVITTYEGKHNHDVPAARGSGMHRQQQSAAATTTMGSSHNNGSSVVRPYTTSLVNNVNTNNNHSYRNDNQGGQAPFTLEMLQTSPGSFGFSGFSMNTNNNNSFMNNQQQQGVFSKTKDEPRDDMFLESLLF